MNNNDLLRYSKQGVIIPVEDSIRIRTGERGDIALYNAEQEK